MNSAPKFFLYLRKSTDETTRQIMSLDAQRRELRDFIRRERLTVIAEFEESRTAKEPGRPLFNNMLARIERGEANGILCWDIDRLYRNPADEGRVRWMLQCGIIAFIRTPTRCYSPADAGILIAVEGGRATDFIIHHRRDVMRGVREKLLKGGWPGNAPIGYLQDKNIRNIVPDPKRAKIVQTIFEEFSTGTHSLLWVADRLAGFGIVSKGGKPWSKSLAHGFLTNPLYMGIMVWSGETFEGKFKPLVSPELFAKVGAALKVRSKPRKTRKGHNFPFCGLFRCTCDSMISAQWAKGHGGLYRYYRCTRKKRNCSERYVQEGAVADQCAKALHALAIVPEDAALVRDLIDQDAANSGKAVEAAASEVAEKLTAVQTKLNKLTRAYLDELLDEESFQAAKADLVTEKAVLKHEKTRLQKTGATYWIEPAKEVINALESAGNIQEAKSPVEISKLVQKIGTNPLIAQKKVTFDFSPPYDFASQFLAETRAAFDPLPVPQLVRGDTSTNWCPGQDSNLHALRQRLLRPSCLPIPPPGRALDFKFKIADLRGVDASGERHACFKQEAMNPGGRCSVPGFRVSSLKTPYSDFTKGREVTRRNPLGHNSLGALCDLGVKIQTCSRIVQSPSVHG